MKKKPKTTNLAALRKQAEEKLAKQAGRLHKLSTQDIEHLIHELGTHQIELEMQNEELRRAQEELEASRSRYADLYDFAPVGYFTFNGQALILEANLTAARELGMERGRIIKQPFRVFVITKDRTIFDDHLREVFQSESRQTCEVRLKRKSGIEFYARLESIMVQDLNGNNVCRTSLIDITENKKTETLLKEERDFISAVLSTEGALVVVLDLQGRIVSFNKTSELITGYSFDEVKGTPLWDFLLIPEEVKPVKSVFKELKAGKYPNKHENYWVTKDGRHRFISWSNTSLLDSNGNVKYVISTGIDITERKRAEDEIKRFASFPQLSPNPVLEVNSSGIIVFCNAATVLTLRELNIGDADVFLPGDLDTILNRLRQGEEASLYREVKIKDKIFEETLHLAPQFNSMRIYANDITERKSYQEALKNALLESRQRSGEIAALLEGSQAVLKYHDFESAARSIFDSCKQVIGATSGYIALLSKDGTENEVLFLDSGGLPCSVDPGLPMPIRGLRGEAYNNLKTVYDNDFHQSEWMKFMPEGHVRLENVLFAPMVVEGKAVGLLGIANKPGGFTENDARISSAFADLAAIALTQKRVEEALRHSEEYFRLVTENLSDVITILDADGTIRYESLSVEKLLGYKPEELIGKDAFELIHPDDRPSIMDVFSQVVRTPGITLSAEFRYQHKDGSWRILGARGSNLLDNPVIRGIVVNSRDITEGKKAEEALRSERQKLINILDSMQDGVYIVDQKYNIEYVNPIIEREYGAVNGRRCYEYFEDRKEACSWCKTPEVLKGESVHWELYSSKTKKTYDVIDTPLKNPDGSISKLEIFRNITERKKKEDELLKLNRTLRALSNSNQAMIHAKSESEFLKEVCKIIVQDCGHAMVWIGFAEDDEGKTVRPVADAGFEKGYLETLNITWADTERGRGPTGTAIRTGRPSICRNMLTDPAFEPWREEAIKRGYASSIVLPLMTDSKALGAINIYSREPDPFTEDEVKLLSELSGDLSYGIFAMRARVAHAEAEQALRTSEARLATFAAATFEGIVHSREGRIVDCNEQFARMMGYTVAELLDREIADLLAPEDRDRVMVNIRQGLHSEIEYAMIRKDGTRVIVEAHGRPDKDGPRGYRMTVLRDITERKQKEELSKALNRINETINSTLDIDEILQLVVVETRKAIGCETAAISLCKDNRWKVSFVSGFTQELVGAEMVEEEEPHAMLALNTGEPVVINDAYNDERVNLEHMKKYGVRSVLVFPLLAGDDPLGVIFLNHHSLPVQFTAAQIDFATKLGVSISLALEKSRLLSALKLRAAELEAVNRELEAFSYTVSHDLKSPLRSIQGFAQAITEDYEDRLDDAGRDSLRRINSAGERMTQLIDSMLEISRLTGRDLLNKSVDLSSIAEVIAYELKKKEPERMVEFIIAEGAKARGDEDMLEIVLRNLLDNAWKFTAKRAAAKIEFGVTQMDGKNIYFVRDNGAGFNMDYADKLFMPFKRLHSASEFPGLGIGLATVKKIINKHGGKIWAESEPEKGATFYFTLE